MHGGKKTPVCRRRKLGYGKRHKPVLIKRAFLKRVKNIAREVCKMNTAHSTRNSTIKRGLNLCSVVPITRFFTSKRLSIVTSVSRPPLCFRRFSRREPPQSNFLAQRANERTNELDVHDFYAKTAANEITSNHLLLRTCFRALYAFSTCI